MERLITLLSWSCFPLLSQKSSTIYAPVSERSSSRLAVSPFFTKCLFSSAVTYLVCTQMRVGQVDGSLAYLTSSFETETFITGLSWCSQKCLVPHRCGDWKLLLFGGNRLPQRSAVRERSESEELHSVDQNAEGQRCPWEDCYWWSLLLPSPATEIPPDEGRFLRWEEPTDCFCFLMKLSIFPICSLLVDMLSVTFRCSSAI